MQSYEKILAVMKQEYSQLTDSSIANDSDVGIRMQVLASQLHAMYSRIEWLLRQMFVQTASEEYLDMHALQYGVNRKAATSSAGTVLFTIDQPVWYDIEIPAGTICATESSDPIRFLTTQTVMLEAGQTQVQTAAESEGGGSGYNVAADTIRTIVNPPQGILKVNNPGAFTGASDEETDEQLRQRIIERCQAVSNGTNTAFYVNEALQYDGVVSAMAIPRARGRGTVDLYLAAVGGAASEAVVQAVQQDLQSRKEINVDLEVKQALTQGLTAQVYIEPAQDYTLEDLTPLVKQAVHEYFYGLKVGGHILIAELGNRIYNIEGVANYRIAYPSNDILVQPQYLVLCNDVTVQAY